MGVLSLIDRKLVSLDEIYYLARLRTQDGKVELFHRGWGSQAALDAIDARWSLPGYGKVPSIRWNMAEDTAVGPVVGGWMESEVYEDQLPEPSRRVTVVLVRPKGKKQHADKAVVLAPTSREGGFRRRWKWAAWLVKQGVTVMMVDNPFMGARKPADQMGSVLGHFTDFPLTCAASAEECRSAVRWLLAYGMKKVCVSGVSQGGFAAIVATLRSDPERVCGVAVVPPNSAEPVIEEGVPGRMCAWDTLASEFGGLEEAKARMKPIFERTRIDAMKLEGAVPKVVVFGGERDKYVPRSSVQRIADHLGTACTMHWTGGGHVSAILERKRYATAIIRSLTTEDEEPVDERRVELAVAGD